MATTTNYGWTTPDNTGYVKDGALAIRTLGNAIDTTLFGIPKGGQGVQATTTTATTTTSGSFVDATNLTASITPTKSTSKILVTINFSGYVEGDPTYLPKGQYQIIRGSTAIYGPLDVANYLVLASGTTAASIVLMPMSLSYLDSPATTSATTYKLQLRRTSSAGSVSVNGFSGQSSIILQEVFA